MAVFNPTNKAVDADGRLTNVFRVYLNSLALSVPIVGTGSPEGVVSAQQYSLYIDESTPSAPVQYRKMLANISGDDSQGWYAL